MGLSTLLNRFMNIYIKNKSQPVATKELMQVFGVPAYLIEQHSSRIDSVLVWGNGLFNSVCNLKFSESDLAILYKAISYNMDNTDGYTTIQTISKYINRTCSTFLAEHEILNRTALFYVLRYYFSGEYSFSNSIHIATKNCIIRC